MPADGSASIVSVLGGTPLGIPQRVLLLRPNSCRGADDLICMACSTDAEGATALETPGLPVSKRTASAAAPAPAPHARGPAQHRGRSPQPWGSGEEGANVDSEAALGLRRRRRLQGESSVRAENLSLLTTPDKRTYPQSLTHPPAGSASPVRCSPRARHRSSRGHPGGSAKQRSLPTQTRASAFAIAAVISSSVSSATLVLIANRLEEIPAVNHRTHEQQKDNRYDASERLRNPIP
jgi:hypothetical protein